MFFLNLNRGLSCVFMASVLAIPVANAAEVNAPTFEQKLSVAANNFIISDLIEQISGTREDFKTIANWVNNNKSILSKAEISKLRSILTSGYKKTDIVGIQESIISAIKILAHTEGNNNWGKLHRN